MADCMSCKHRKAAFVPCDWLAEQKTIIMPPCSRYEKEETVKEYIERASVHSIIERTSTFAFTRGGMHERVDSLPAADVAPARHGHWINIPPYQCEAGYKKGQQCSECYAYYVSDGAAPWSNHKYCAECGAKMDGKIEWEGEQP